MFFLLIASSNPPSSAYFRESAYFTVTSGNLQSAENFARPRTNIEEVTCFLEAQLLRYLVKIAISELLLVDPANIIPFPGDKTLSLVTDILKTFDCTQLTDTIQSNFLTLQTTMLTQIFNGTKKAEDYKDEVIKQLQDYAEGFIFGQVTTEETWQTAYSKFQDTLQEKGLINTLQIFKSVIHTQVSVPLHNISVQCSDTFISDAYGMIVSHKPQS